MRKTRLRILLGLVALVLLAVAVFYIPPVHSRLAWRLDDLRVRIKYYFNPPDQAIFVPTQSQLDMMVTQTLASALTPSPTETPRLTDLATPTITPTPLPTSVSLTNPVYVDQHGGYNLCGPANLTMALKFWGWPGTRDDVIKVVKPGINDPSLDFIDRSKTDKNVMPQEMVDFVNNHTDLRAIDPRYGGNVDLVKRLIAAGYPVLTEKGYYERDYTGKMGWMGHYQFITGYDNNTNEFIVQDTYLDGPNFHVSYDKFVEGWRSFDYVFFVVYPADHEEQVYNLLSPWGNPDWPAQHALDVANQEIQTLSRIDLYFAWFNKGTSHVLLRQYFDAASAYDYAFSLYAGLGSDDQQRPYRMMWYQTGPYKAYYYSDRYQDVINLANTTLATLDAPTLEESLFWRSMAEYKLGQTDAAYADMRQTVYLNPNFDAGWIKIQEWGITP